MQISTFNKEKFVFFIKNVSDKYSQEKSIWKIPAVWGKTTLIRSYVGVKGIRKSVLFEVGESNLAPPTEQQIWINSYTPYMGDCSKTFFLNWKSNKIQNRKIYRPGQANWNFYYYKIVQLFLPRYVLVYRLYFDQYLTTRKMS